MTEETENRLAVPVGEGDRIRGPVDAPLTLVEYGDYDCPHTVQAHAVVRGLEKRLGDRLRFVFRAFPLTEIHENAQAAAEAAEAADFQGKFWPMHDRLMQAHRKLSDADLEEYAEEVGLDAMRFDRQMLAHAHAAKVRTQMEGGLASGVEGTPTFFVNGVRHEGSHDLESLMAALEDTSR
jgi:protein-disulfide isomerase